MEIRKFKGNKRTYGEFKSSSKLVTKKRMQIVRWKDGNLSIGLTDEEDD